MGSWQAASLMQEAPTPQTATAPPSAQPVSSLPSGACDLPVFVVGCGAVGLALAAFLQLQGRQVTAVRSLPGQTSHRRRLTIAVDAGDHLSTEVTCVPLESLSSMDGIVAITAKAFANPMLASILKEKAQCGPVVLLQNGLGVEAPFLQDSTTMVYRAVLYVTCQFVSSDQIKFRAIAPSPVGPARPGPSPRQEMASGLNSPWFPFIADADVHRAVWKKAIVNAVFNSLCPLLETDNGLFDRDLSARVLAHEVVSECVALASTEGVDLDAGEVMNQILQISRGSHGVLISTLQDIRQGRETEIEFLNLAMAKRAQAISPPLPLTKTHFLGRMVQIKAAQSRRS